MSMDGSAEDIAGLRRAAEGRWREDARVWIAQLEWMLGQPRIAAVLDRIEALVPFDELMLYKPPGEPPPAGFAEANVSIAMHLLRRVRSGVDPAEAVFELDIVRKVTQPFRNRSVWHAIATGRYDYIGPAQLHLAAQLEQLDKGVTPDALIERRIEPLRQPEFRERFPHTSEQFDLASRALAREGTASTWLLVTNTCRRSLVAFLSELTSRPGREYFFLPPDVMGGRPHLVRITGCISVSPDRRLVESLWSFAHPPFARPHTTWQDAQRLHDWAMLVICELWDEVQHPASPVDELTNRARAAIRTGVDRAL
jgi:hypothetical protein